MPSDVETAGHIIERNRTHTRHEDTFKRTLEFLEDVTIKAFSMGNGTIYSFALLVEHRVGEVVIFVDDEIGTKIQFFRFIVDKYQLVYGVFSLEDLLYKILRIVLTVNIHKTIQLHFAITVKLVFQLVDTSAYLRKIKIENQVFTLKGSRILANPQIAEQILELILHATIIVSLEHTDEYALAKTARTDKEEVYRLVFQCWQIHRLVYIVIVLLYDLYEVIAPIRYSFSILLHISSVIYNFVQRYNYLGTIPKKNGFFSTVCRKQHSWQILIHSYLDGPYI